MDYELVAANVRPSYREVSPKYRQDDEIEVTTENHQHYSSILRDISSSFDRLSVCWMLAAELSSASFADEEEAR